MYTIRDFYWKRVGWRWEIWTRLGDYHFRYSDYRFWRWRSAAIVCNEIFAAYHAGRDAERGIPGSLPGTKYIETASPSR